MTRNRNRSETMKKILLIGLAAALVLCTAGCKKAEKEKPSEESAPETSVVVDVSTPEPVTISVKMATVFNVSGTLNVRSEPNTDCEVLGSAVSGDKFEVITENCQPGWHEIAYQGGKAYISADYAKITEEVQVAPTPTPDPNAPIIVNGSGREEVSKDTGEEGMTTDSIKETEDPARR
ncbi:MAG: SH3 domain-containing protein [Clostridia bacterium]|nr:SH3 domain-containing protein [Clostridia bacterium]